MGKISAEAFSRAGDKYLGRKYEEMDCQKFVEKAMADAGLKMDLGGSNSWYREMTWTGTPEECRKVFGSIPKGALCYIWEPVSASTPAKFRNDGIGDITHIGIVTRRSGKEMAAHGKEEGAKNPEKYNFGDGAIHSSYSKGHVCTSRFEDKSINGGWNRIGLYRMFTYGEAIDARLAGNPGGIQPDVPTGTGGGESSGGAGSGDTGGQEMGSIQTGVIRTENGGPANLRNTASMKDRLWWKIPAGNTIEVDQTGIVKNGYEWVHGSAMDEKYQLVTGYMRKEFVALDADAEGFGGIANHPAANANNPAANTSQPAAAAQAAAADGPGNNPAANTNNPAANHPAGGYADEDAVTLVVTLPRDRAEAALDFLDRLTWALTQTIGRG